MKRQSDSDSYIALRATKQPRRDVIDLNNSNINSTAGADIYTTTDDTRNSRLPFGESRRTRARRDTRVGADVDAIVNMSNTHEGMYEWLERFVGRVVFDLKTAGKIVEM